MKGFVYILECNNWRYYVGSTNDLERRINEHKKWKSIYTSTHLPVKIVFQKEFENIDDARKFEKYIKKQKDRSFIKKLCLNKCELGALVV